MTALYPPLHMESNSSWFSIDSQTTEWTKEENKLFESALAIYDENTPNRWLKVAAMIPGKTEWDVIQQYKELVEDVSEIEAGRVPLPGYLSSSFTLELVDTKDYDGCRKSSLSARSTSDNERKKGVPWTVDEHRRFLMGLVKYGKGDWRNISRNFVVTKTPTQVASHAQKYYIRQQSGGKDKRRPSIHDIKISNLTEDTPSDNNMSPSVDEASVLSTRQRPKVLFNWNNPSNGRLVFLTPDQASSTSFDTSSDELQLQEKVLHDDDGFYGTYMKPQNSLFEIHSSGHQILG